MSLYLVISVLVCLVLLLAAVSAVSVGLVKYLYSDRLKWIKRYAELYNALSKVESELLKLFVSGESNALIKVIPDGSSVPPKEDLN